MSRRHRVALAPALLGLLLALACRSDETPPGDDDITGDDDTATDDDTGETPPVWEPGDILAKIRPDHPRIFLSADTLEAVRARAFGAGNDHYEKIAGYVEGYPTDPAAVSCNFAPSDCGPEAMNAAFVYLMTGDPAILDRARALLTASVDYYESQTASGQAVSWYCLTRVSALAAYDWIADDLAPEERADLGGRLLQHVHDVQPEVNPNLGENTSGYTSGFYGVTNLPWYAGLAFYGDGIDDALAEQLLLDGLEMHVGLYEHRRACAGDDGGSASATIGYAWGAYPWAEFNFLHSWRSATGEDLAGVWTHLATMTSYMLYNRLPGDREFGWGDAYHDDNVIDPWMAQLHLAQLAHFFADEEPELAGLAWWYLHDWVGGIDGLSGLWWGVHPLLLTNLDDPPAQVPPPDDLPLARHFEALGQIAMRSGSGEHDTYALFTAGGTVDAHRHYDENSFVIFRDGFQALDTGTRHNEYDPDTQQHLSEYYARTVAHNAVLIVDDGEDFSSIYYWDWFDHNDGGQNARGASILAFESGDGYAYVASDATACYSSDKAAEVVRQLVFLPPDHLVVFDRVTTVRDDQQVLWLLHTAAEPSVPSARVATASHEGGRIVSQTLLPEDAQVRVEGGAGREFWVIDQNFSFGGYDTLMTDLMGRYRVEVTPGQAATVNRFLHLIHVGDASLSPTSEGALLQQGERVGVSFDDGDRSLEVLFDSTGEVGGHVRIEEGGQVLVDQELAVTVQPQSGFPG